MKPVVMIAMGAAALSLTACDRNGAPLFGPAAAMKPVSRLDCPERQGALKRLTTSTDGQTCTYTDGEGSDVALHIIKIAGDPHLALRPLEASLSSMAALQGSAEPEADDVESSEPVEPPAASDGVRATARAAGKQASQDARSTSGNPEDSDEDDWDAHANRHAGRHRGRDEHVTVDFPGLHVNADGDNAKVDLLGMHIDANGDKGSAHVTHQPRSGVGRSFVFDGNDSGGLLRTEHVGHANFRTTVMWMTDNDSPHEYSSVGYVAAGPRAGPLVVATVKVKGGETHGVYESAGQIIRRASRN